MVTQTIQFEAVSLREIGSGSITAELFQGSVSKGTLSAIAEDGTRNGRYTGTVADKPAGDYDIQARFNGYTVSEPGYSVALLLTAGTYVAAMSTGGLTPEESETLDSIAVALAGSAPVEPTGVTVFEQLNLIQSNTSSLSNLTASLPLSPGVIVGPSEPLVIGDDYTSAVGRQVRVNLLSSTGGSAATAFGSKSLSDAGISIQLLLRKSGQPSAVAQLVGTCSFFPAETVDGVEIPPYLLVSFSRTETAKATPGVYDMQGEAVWLSGDVVTFAPYGQIEFVRNILRVG